MNGLSVASIHGAGHTILLVSDLEGRELSQLSTTLAVPLVGQLLSDLIPVSPRAMATLFPGAAPGRIVADADD